jgi:hypothetical protein
MSTNEPLQPIVNDGWTIDYQMIRLDNFARRGWSKDANGVTYSVSSSHPEIERWIKQQNPDMFSIVAGRKFWFTDPELEILFLLRWG